MKIMLCREIKFGCESNSNATFQDLFSLEVMSFIFLTVINFHAKYKIPFFITSDVFGQKIGQD